MDPLPNFRWAPRLKVGRYELLAPIASGGMAEVWLAKQVGPEAFEKLVALKRILATATAIDETVSMFKDEARIAGQLNHPHVAQTFELAEDSGTWYLAMEYLAGETLSKVLKEGFTKKTPLPIGLAVRIASDAASGLGYAHHLKTRAGKPLDIVHRDVSPQNIMVTYEGEVKVVDFGIARAASRIHRTQVGLVKGKVQYMAPEQANGSGEIDARADVFSLGLCLYEMLIGARVYGGDEQLALQTLVSGTALPPIREKRFDVPEAIEIVLLKALSPSPAGRFTSGQELQAALEECLGNLAPPTSAFELKKYMRGMFADRMEQHRAMAASQVAASTATTVEPMPAMATPMPAADQATIAQRQIPKGSQGGVRRQTGPHKALEPMWKSPAVIASGVLAVLGLSLALYAATRTNVAPPPPPPPVLVSKPPPVMTPDPEPAPPPQVAAPEPEPAPAPPPPPARKKPAPVKKGTKLKDE